MEISKEDLLHFLKCWLKNYKVNLDLDKVFELINLVNKCYEDNMMFDSWFKGMNVMD